MVTVNHGCIQGVNIPPSKGARDEKRVKKTPGTQLLTETSDPFDDTET